MTEHQSIRMRAGLLTLRDAQPDDSEAFVKYWCDSSDSFLKALGVDREKLGSPEEIRQRFLGMIRNPDREQARIIFSITLNDNVIGYSNINRYTYDDNYPHVHTYRSIIKTSLSSDGRQAGNKGGESIGPVIVGQVIDMYFRLFPINRLIIQTRTRNFSINRALDFYLPPAETRYFERPDGLSGPGEFHMRFVERNDAPWMLNRSKELANSTIHAPSIENGFSVGIK